MEFWASYSVVFYKKEHPSKTTGKYSNRIKRMHSVRALARDSVPKVCDTPQACALETAKTKPSLEKTPLAMRSRSSTFKTQNVRNNDNNMILLVRAATSHILFRDTYVKLQ